MEILKLNEVTQLMIDQLKPFEVISEQAFVLIKHDVTMDYASFNFELQNQKQHVLKWDFIAYEGASLNLKSKDGLVFGCMDQGICKGILSLEVIPWKKTLHITHLFIQQMARSKGQGHALLECAKQVAIDKKLCFLSVEVQSRNGVAIQYYQHMGFEMIGFECDRYNTVVEFEEDIAIFMKKRLE